MTRMLTKLKAKLRIMMMRPKDQRPPGPREQRRARRLGAIRPDATVTFTRPGHRAAAAAAVPHSGSGSPSPPATEEPRLRARAGAGVPDQTVARLIVTLQAGRRALPNRDVHPADGGGP